MEITYTKVGDYLIPNIVFPKQKPIGKYGSLRRKFLEEHRTVEYNSLLLSGELNEHLYRIDTLARDEVMAFMEAREKKAPDKASDPMAWIGYINNQKNCAEEIVFSEIVYK